MCSPNDSKQIEEREKEKERFKVSLETRNFEIELFWKSSLFFGDFNDK